MKQILDDLNVQYTVGIDEAAFYGPKLDIQYKNVFGKEDTIVTIQIDMLLAERFGMEYTDSDGQKKRPYIIHRTSLGCYERTLAYLMQKIPYMLVVGDRDMENGTVSVRTRSGEDLGAMTPEEFLSKCLLQIATKSKEV